MFGLGVLRFVGRQSTERTNNTKASSVNPRFTEHGHPSLTQLSSCGIVFMSQGIVLDHG